MTKKRGVVVEVAERPQQKANSVATSPPRTRVSRPGVQTGANPRVNGITASTAIVAVLFLAIVAIWPMTMANDNLPEQAVIPPQEASHLEPALLAPTTAPAVVEEKNVRQEERESGVARALFIVQTLPDDAPEREEVARAAKVEMAQAVNTMQEQPEQRLPNTQVVADMVIQLDAMMEDETIPIESRMVMAKFLADESPDVAELYGASFYNDVLFELNELPLPTESVALSNALFMEALGLPGLAGEYLLKHNEAVRSHPKSESEPQSNPLDNDIEVCHEEDEPEEKGKIRIPLSFGLSEMGLEALLGSDDSYIVVSAKTHFGVIRETRLKNQRTGSWESFFPLPFIGKNLQPGDIVQVQSGVAYLIRALK